ncbi:bifunctional helix-turn-helix transcriptional regulator/GNAT family N-acetyltransferase [Natronobacterium gregoryi]|uniref:GNAT family N-acetyltransferase n=2 Tax=Natronobacterium gregoryi TaxID=44930 RepID=L0ALT8_NATGS|nr:bifunctional helix-turn-helix transcriptional regulator/GNAT family N-acetyltransferase [Natronobacterium gregoryi]AFZ74020.1 sortase-like acyltransferase [Natronobacterium gregoryi SP2]ELY70592.1 N-acetyltransferase GCN5 [Natronobacterium gregoryi SP2]PLK20769.1 GNAT family N-acetyltransferase [Natronobacterium gregoryi SP2]SFJ07546.1 L-amino acid N-acyltransferase YncA [Natronobacterium gregoryi]
METSERLEFRHEDRKRIYEYVERHGAVTPDEVQERLGSDPSGFRHHVAILKRDDRLEEVDGRLRVTIDAGAKAEYVSADLEFSIRPARQEDLAGIVGAIRRVAEEKSYIVAESVADEIDHEEALLRYNELESRMFFVATVDGEVVGWVHLYAPELDKLSHTAELTVGVIEEYRGHGIGSHLLSRGLEWAGSSSYEKVYNSVPSSNEEAIAFLEAHDWKTEAVREDHYKLDGHYADEVMMAVEL